MGILNVNFCTDLILLRQSYFTVDKVVYYLITCPDSLGNFLNRSTQILAIPDSIQDIALRKALIDCFNMVVQVMIQFCVIRVSSSESLIVPFQYFCLFLLQLISRCRLNR